MNKLIKKISILLLSLLTVATFGMAVTACGDKGDNNQTSIENSGDEDIGSYAYRVSVENQTGYGLKDVTVTLKNGSTEVATAKTNSNGNANFSDVAAGVYTIEISNLPKGYTMQDGATYKTAAQTGTKITVPLTPTGVIMEDTPPTTSYKLGDVMYDFSIQTSDGNTFTLSEELKEKEMVLLNFWGIGCGPCAAEFPTMNSAAISYADKVSVLAVSAWGDTKEAVANYKQQTGLTFDMASDSIGICSKFNVGPVPHSVIIDRYGVIVFSHVGSMTAISDFTARFDLFSGVDYVSTVVPGDGEDAIDPDQPVVEILKPNVPAPSLADVKEVMGGSDAFTYSWDEDEYSWPWVISEDNKYLYTPTTNIHNSFVTLIVDFEAEAGKALQFDYFINSEEYDKFYVLMDGEYAHSLSDAFNNNWQTCTAYVFDETTAGKHQMVLLFYKDGDTSSGEDMVKMNNLRFVDVSTLNRDDVNANIFRNASWGLNEAGESTQYKHYADVAYNTEDGYYHVNSVDGPILFASLMTVNNWNTYALWDLAYNNYIVIDGFNYSLDVEDFAWEANNNMFNTGYTPVTQELKDLLDIIVSVDIYGEKYDCEYHENEWLELCAYYDHYGNTPQVEDPMKGITFHAAIPLKEGSNDINVPFAINPRGFKYKFIPSKSGVYAFYSTGLVDTLAFFADAPNNIIADYDESVGADTRVDENGDTIKDRNFKFYQYLEAGHTYYVLCHTFDNQPATYNMEVEYIGKTYKYLENAAKAPYSFNETTGENYLPNAKEYEYADPAKTYTYAETGETGAGDGYYRIKNKDGSLGSIIYFDINRPTEMFQDTSIYDVVLSAEKNFPDETKRVFYINGHDYTPDLKKLCFAATTVQGELNGFVAVNQEIFELMSILITGTESALEGVDNAWLLLCYYFNYLG